MRHTVSLAVIAILCSAPALAQTPAAPPPDGPAQTLSLNPFGLMLEWANLEYERKISPTTTLGAAAAHNAFFEYSNVELLARYYPEGHALRGFYLGARAGGFGIEVTEYQYPTPPVPRGDPRSYPPYPIVIRRRQIVPGLGLEVGYNWLLGREQRIAIGLGFGLTRLFRESDDDYYPTTLPHPRIVNVGIAF
jgi:hypothetical protein